MLKYKFFIKFRKFTALRNKHDASVPAIWLQHKIFTLGRFQEIKKYAQLLLKQIFDLLGIYICLMPRWDIIQSIGKLFVCPIQKNCQNLCLSSLLSIIQEWYFLCLSIKNFVSFEIVTVVLWRFRSTGMLHRVDRYNT